VNRTRWLSWNDARTRAIVWQAAVVVMVCAIVALVAVQAATNLEQRGIVSGFAYLSRSAGFEITQACCRIRLATAMPAHFPWDS
jgi:general L-amino acid transport system permease protein